MSATRLLIFAVLITTIMAGLAYNPRASVKPNLANPRVGLPIVAAIGTGAYALIGPVSFLPVVLGATAGAFYMNRGSFLDRLAETLSSFGAAKPQPTATVPAPAPEAPAEPPFNYQDERIPKLVRENINNMLKQIGKIEESAVKSLAAIETLTDIRMMRDRHLPSLLRSYMEMPTLARDVIFKKTGRSASYSLRDALIKMESRLDQIARAQAEGDIDAFDTNMSFISQRYGDDPFYSRD